MRRTRLLASTVVVALAALSVGAATAWFSDSETIRFEISAADSFGAPKVWVCKLIGPPDNPAVKPGKNPIHVSIDSVDAQEGFSDAHPSYVVDHGDVVCEVPAAVDEAPDVAPRTDPGTIADPTGPTPDEPDVTTSTSISTVTETTPATTSSTTTLVTDPTTSTAVEPVTTTTTTSATTTTTESTTSTTDPSG